jgi:WD40 repeat protein
VGSLDVEGRIAAQASGAGTAATSGRTQLKDRFRELTKRRDGSWLEDCARLRHDQLALRELLQPGHQDVAALEEEGPLWPKPSSQPSPQLDTAARLVDEQGDGPALSAARAIVSVALALADPTLAATELRRSIRHWQRANVVPDGLPAAIPATLFHHDDAALRSVLVRADELKAGPPSAYTALIALTLVSTDTLNPQTSVEVPVLFDRERVGSSAILRLGAVRSGPIGLYPDPCRMAFLAADEDFAAALEAAWAASGGRLHDRCVTWAILDHGVPCNIVTGGSLGAAFAVALDELARKLSRPTGMRLKRLDHHCAVTGSVDAQQRLRQVRGYPNKLEAARDAKLRVVAPRESEHVIRPIAERQHVEVDFADNVKQAIDLTRTRLNRAALATLLLIIVLIATAGAGIGLAAQARTQQHQAAVGRQLLAKADDLRGSDPVTSMALNVEAARLAPGPDSRARLLAAVAQPHLIAKAPDRSAPNKVLLSADGRRMLTGNGPYVPTGNGPNSTVTLWQVPGRHRVTPLISWSVPDLLDQIALSPDGSRVAVAFGVVRRVVEVWDVDEAGNAKRIGRFTACARGSAALSFSHHEKLVSAACVGERVIRWDVEQRAVAGSFPLPAATISYSGDPSGMALSPGLDALAAVVAENAVSLWKLTGRGGAERASTIPAASIIGRVTFRAAGRQLAVADRSGVRLFGVGDLRHPDLLGSISLSGGGSDAAFSPRGNMLATVGDDGSVTLWNIANPSKPSALSTLLSRGGVAVAFGADGRELAITERDSTVSVWDIPTPRAVSVLADRVAGGVTAAAFAPDGRTVAVATPAKVLLWDTSDASAPIQLAALNGDSVHAVRFSQDGRTLSAATNTGRLLTWDLTDRTHPQDLPVIADPVVFSLPSEAMAYSGDGRRLALPTASTTITVWDTARTGQLNRLAVLDTVQDVAYAVALSSNGRYLAATGSGGTVVLWDLTRSDRVAATWRIATTSLTAVTFSADDRLLAVGGTDGTVAVWDVSRPSRPQQLAMPGGTLGTVNTVAFSPDTQKLVTAGDQQTAKIWSVTDPRNPVLLGTAAGPAASIKEVVWSPDSKLLLIAGEDQDAILWDVSGLIADPGNAATEVCATEGARLSRSQWQQYLGGLRYHPTC